MILTPNDPLKVESLIDEMEEDGIFEFDELDDFDLEMEIVVYED